MRYPSRSGRHYRSFVRDAVLHSTGMQGLGNFCDNTRAQAGVGGALAAVQMIGAGLARGEGSSAQAGKTTAQAAGSAQQLFGQLCSGSQGQAGGGTTTNAPQGNAEMLAMFQQQQQQAQILAQQQQSQVLNLQQQQFQQQQAQAAQTRNLLIGGGILVAAVAAVAFLKK